MHLTRPLRIAIDFPEPPFENWNQLPSKGRRLMIYVRDADTWKIRMTYAN
jgi:hypothetical protein